VHASWARALKAQPEPIDTNMVSEIGAWQLLGEGAAHDRPPTTRSRASSPAISYFGTEVIGVVTTHGNDRSAGRKMHGFECHRDVRR
jgi:hypothetical protein